MSSLNLKFNTKHSIDINILVLTTKQRFNTHFKYNKCLKLTAKYMRLNAVINQTGLQL